MKTTNPITEYLQQREEVFDAKQTEWLSPDPLEPQYMIPDMKAIKSFQSETVQGVISLIREAVGKDTGETLSMEASANKLRRKLLSLLPLTKEQ